jgi:CRP-like cAMP-binding protein
MNIKTGPRQNHLLALLPEGECGNLFSALELVILEVGDVLSDPNQKLRYAYFPVDSTISLYSPANHGMSAEIALIGNDGMFSIASFMGGGSLPYVATIETAGHAYRLDVRVLKQEFERGGKLQHVMLLYAQALFTQTAQISICGRGHSLRQQYCLHLLLLCDRLPSGRLVLTQQAIAHMLGVRRESVTKVSGELRREKLIDYRRGRITVLDRPGLERECCECYSITRQEFRRLLG